MLFVMTDLSYMKFPECKAHAFIVVVQKDIALEIIPSAFLICTSNKMFFTLLSADCLYTDQWTNSLYLVTLSSLLIHLLPCLFLSL
jgi:hypothetical protein